MEFAHRDIPFGLQRETAEETSEDGRDTAFTLTPRACDHATMAYRRSPLPVMKVTRRPAIGEKSVEFARRDIPFGLQREMAEETSEDGRDTDRHEVGDIDVDRFLLGMPDEKEDAIQHEFESRAIMAGWEKIRKHLIDVVAEDAAMPLGQVCIPLYRGYWFIGLSQLRMEPFPSSAFPILP